MRKPRPPSGDFRLEKRAAAATVSPPPLPTMSPTASRSTGSHPEGRPPRSRNEMAVLFIVSLFFALMLTLELARDFTPRKLSVPFFLASWALLLAVHEFGHAVAARLLGWRVELISIGTGKVRARIEWRGVPVEFRTLPLSGFVLPRPADLAAPRLKQFLIFAAGPGIELLLAAGCVLLFGSDRLLARSDEPGIIAVQSFCVAALLGAFFNLLPFSHRSGEGAAWSDGLGMLLCWGLPDEWFRRRVEEGAGDRSGGGGEGGTAPRKAQPADG